jgi:hypothetical protein
MRRANPSIIGRRRRRRLAIQQLESRRLLAGHPIISEFVASNQSSLVDGFGDHPDWIEIYNDSDTAVDLNGYHLTDKASAPSKWEFTSPTPLAPGDFLIVFASSRSTIDPAGFHHTSFNLSGGGEYVALTAPDLTVLNEFGIAGADYPPQVPDISYGVPGTVLIDGESVAEYLIPVDGSLGESWTANTFDGLANGFSLGRAAIGYENSPGSATSYANLFQTSVAAGTTNVYQRIQFDIEDALQITDLKLSLNYDDGIVIYLNGTKLLDRNAPDPLGFNTPAAAVHDDSLALAGEVIDLDAHVGLLLDGPNTLAIHSLNRPSSSDMLMVPELSSQSIAGAVNYLLEPTPGAANTLGQTLGPLVSDVAPSLPIADAGQPLTITARIDDFASPLDPVTVSLQYRIMFGAEVSLMMRDDGLAGDAVAADRIFTAQIPASALNAGEMVRWYVVASDTEGIQTREPRFLDPLDAAEYFGTVVDDPTITTDLPLMQWFLANESAASSNAGTRASLFMGGEFYDNIQVDNHGQSTRGSAFPKKSFDFDANAGNKFRIRSDVSRVSDFNLLTNYADQTKLRNTLTYDLFAQADYAHHLAFSVTVYRNGGFYGLYDLVEEGDTEYLERLGLDPQNPLYKVNNGLNNAYTNVEKKSREYEDHSDFQDVVNAAQNLSGAAALTWDFDNLDIADMINYLAINNVAVSSDFGHKNMYWYRDTLGTGLWSVLPWDQDLSLGHQWDASISPPYFKDALITNLNVFLGGNTVFQRLYADPAFREMYVRRVRTLADKFYGQAGSPTINSYLAQHILQLEPLIADEAIQDANLWGIQANFTHTPAQAADQLINEFIPLRRDFVNGLAAVPGSQLGSPEIRFDVVDYDADPASGLQTEEYVRLNNPNGFAVDISGWQLNGGIDHTFKGGTVLPAGGSLYVVKDVNAFKARTLGPTGGQRLLIQGNYSGQLTFTGETVALVDLAGAVKDTLVTPPGTPTTNQRFLRVTEIHYNPLAASTEFIEFANISSGGVATSLDLSGVTITDGPTVPFVFAPGTTLDSGQRLLVVQNSGAMLAAYPTLSAALIAGEYVGNLSNGGERIKVVDAGSETLFDLSYTDGDPWPIAADGSGASLVLTNEQASSMEILGKPYQWRSSVVAGGTPAMPALTPYDVVINEVLAHTDVPLSDSIELHNSSVAPVDIGGWYLSDSGNDLLKHMIPAGTVIPAGGYLVFDESDFNPTPLTPAANHFALSGSHGDSVWLVVPDAGGTEVAFFVDQVEFGGTFNGVSLGRPDDAASRLVPLDERSLGGKNGPHQQSELVVTEVHYHPASPSLPTLAIDPTIEPSDLEFVEVYNRSTDAIDLTNWRLRGDGDFDFSAGSSIAGGESLVLVRFDPSDVADATRLAAFREEYGIDATVTLVGPMDPSLGNSYGLVKLQKPDMAPVDEPTVVPQVLVDEVYYDDLVPWPEEADAAGMSLQRVGIAALGNDVGSWRGATPTPGTLRFVPSIQSITINEGDSSRSAVTSVGIQFSTEVTDPAAAVSLVNATTNEQVGGLLIQSQDTDRKTFVTLTFGPGTSVIGRTVGANTLAGGDYVLHVMATQITSSSGAVPMEQDVIWGDDPADQFFRKYGDHDGSGLVDLFDFASFRQAFGSSDGSPGYLNDLDANGDGTIDLFDFAAFRANFGS